MKLAPPPTPEWNRETARRLALAAGLGALIALTTCSPRESLLTRVETLKVLRMATLNSPTTYYVGAAGPTGFEYDLARSFADELGVALEVVVADSPSEVLEWVGSGRAHLGAGLSVTINREKRVRFTPALRNVSPQMVYRKGQPRPKSLYELNGVLRVPGDSAAAEVLATLAQINPQLRWEESDEFGSEQLLYQVANGEVDYTVVPSDLVAINQRYYPQLRVAFTLPDSQQLAWAFAPGDDTLYGAALSFVEGLDRKNLSIVLDRHFGHVSRVGTYGALALATHTQTRLPRYRKSFEEAAARAGMDWRLLASVGYQESMWDPAAVSPTGVRGLMQITRDTAEFLNIHDRLDPKQSIAGAARYLQQLTARLPPEVKEPDRTWMTLAAYNVGMGHVHDAMALTRQQNGDPTRWVDVRTSLPLLTQSKWHRQTRYGYARGHEAVTYVGNIRTYYDMLSWITGGPVVAQQAPLEEPPPEKQKLEEPLNIRSPIL